MINQCRCLRNVSIDRGGLVLHVSGIFEPVCLVRMEPAPYLFPKNLKLCLQPVMVLWFNLNRRPYLVCTVKGGVILATCILSENVRKGGLIRQPQGGSDGARALS